MGSVDRSLPTRVTDADSERNPGFLLFTPFQKIGKVYKLLPARTDWTRAANRGVFLIVRLFL